MRHLRQRPYKALALFLFLLTALASTHVQARCNAHFKFKNHANEHVVVLVKHSGVTDSLSHDPNKVLKFRTRPVGTWAKLWQKRPSHQTIHFAYMWTGHRDRVSSHQVNMDLPCSARRQLQVYYRCGTGRSISDGRRDTKLTGYGIEWGPIRRVYFPNANSAFPAGTREFNMIFYNNHC